MRSFSMTLRWSGLSRSPLKWSDRSLKPYQTGRIYSVTTAVNLRAWVLRLLCTSRTKPRTALPQAVRTPCGCFAHWHLHAGRLGTQNGRLQDKYYKSFRTVRPGHVLNVGPGALERLCKWITSWLSVPRARSVERAETEWENSTKKATGVGRGRQRRKSVVHF